MHFNSKATLTNNIDYSCHVIVVKPINYMVSISRHIMLLVNASLEDGIYTHTNFTDESKFKKSGMHLV